MSKYKNLEKLFNEGCHFFSVQFLTLGIIYYAYAAHITSNFLKAVFHKLYLIHSWMLCLMCMKMYYDSPIRTNAFLLNPTDPRR